MDESKDKDMRDGTGILVCDVCGHRTIFSPNFPKDVYCDNCKKMHFNSIKMIYRICPQCDSHDEYSLTDTKCTSCEGNLVNDAVDKPTNPKDIIGSNKLPIHLWPTTASYMGCLALLDGALKYGRSNYRVIGVKASIYLDACKRHIDKYAAGEYYDGDSKIPHLSHALACLAIIVDADAAGKLTDDREVTGGLINLLDDLTPHVARLKELHKDKNPKHYTIQDNEDTQ